MTLTRRKPKTWLCKCGHRNEVRTSSRRCDGCGEQTKRKPRRPKHAEITRGDTYHLFVRAAEEIHGVTDESCCVCGKPRPQSKHHDRDHDHNTGHARGLACGGDSGCNVLMMRWVTAATAKGIYEAKAEAGEPDAERWRLIAWYLERVSNFYARAL